MSLFWPLILLVFGLCQTLNANDCQKRRYDQESFVCVCDSYGCDYPQPLGTLIPDTAAIYTTSRDNDRLNKTVETIGAYKKAGAIRGRIFPQKTYQKLIGFGGAITDASMIVLDRLRKSNPGSCPLCQQLQNQYYGDDGIAYTLGRVNIASCDFSDREYSYLEKDQDFELTSFKLSPYEYNRTSFLREVIAKTKGQIKLFASPWSAPAWMKSSGKMKGGGLLRGGENGVYYLTYARYFLRFFEEYFKEGIKFWGLTLINEPGAGLDPFYDWQAMYLSPDMQREFVKRRLAPLLKNHWLTKDIKIMAHDDQRDQIYDAAKKIYKDGDTYIDGLGVHWYSQSPYDTLTSTHLLRPDKFILATEACNAYLNEEHIPLLGSWYYGEKYASDIINNLLNYVAGWTDWNIFLDEYGGPNWVGNFVDAPIIVNVTGQEFYKQPMFYVLGHFSKFVLPDSVRIQIKIDGFEGKSSDHLQAVAFQTPENNYVVILHNRDPFNSFTLALGVGDQPKKNLNVKIDPKTLKTIIFKA